MENRQSGVFSRDEEKIYIVRAEDFANSFGITVIMSRNWIALKSCYPAALQDCYQTLVFMKMQATAQGIVADKIMADEEGARGALCSTLYAGT